ncbi:hypothetical protein NL676_007291 [Syzygium grande]|nr:hypothetical protein NL676_007291 [Syzygium grande]
MLGSSPQIRVQVYEETELRNNNQRDFARTGKFAGTARGSCWNLTVNVGLVAQLDGSRDYDTSKWLELLDCCDGSSDFRNEVSKFAW